MAKSKEISFAPHFVGCMVLALAVAQSMAEDSRIADQIRELRDICREASCSMILWIIDVTDDIDALFKRWIQSALP
ncbi:hypothetical protein BH10CYA1_BH10CYA1_64960 [soil metagenome]